MLTPCWRNSGFSSVILVSLSKGQRAVSSFVSYPPWSSWRSPEVWWKTDRPPSVRWSQFQLVLQQGVLEKAVSSASAFSSVKRLPDLFLVFWVYSERNTTFCFYSHSFWLKEARRLPKFVLVKVCKVKGTLEVLLGKAEYEGQMISRLGVDLGFQKAKGTRFGNWDQDVNHWPSSVSWYQKELGFCFLGNMAFSTATDFYFKKL